MRRTAEDAAKTRRALLAAALMSFEQEGWRGATFELIAQRAGVTRGALHHHFRDKSTLLREALAWGWTQYGQQLFVEEQARWTGLRTLLTGYLSLLRDDPLFRALAAATVLTAPRVFAEKAAEQSSGASDKAAGLDAWRERIAELIRSDPETTSPLPAAQIAGLTLVIIQGLTVTAVTRPHDLPPPDHLDALAEALIKGGSA